MNADVLDRPMQMVPPKGQRIFLPDGASGWRPEVHRLWLGANPGCAIPGFNSTVTK
jgi:hypothetical protein